MLRKLFSKCKLVFKKAAQTNFRPQNNLNHLNRFVNICKITKEIVCSFKRNEKTIFRRKTKYSLLKRMICTN